MWAKWDDGIVLNVQVTFPQILGENVALTPDPAGSFSQSQLTDVWSLQIVAAPPSGKAFTGDIEWYYSNSDIDIGDKSATLTINVAGNINFKAVGLHEFTVVAIIDGDPYSGTYTFEVTN